MATIVIGNGYDKHCGRRTSYGDFFSFLQNPDKDFNNKEWGEEQALLLRSFLCNYKVNNPDIYFNQRTYDDKQSSLVSKLNFWVLYFATVSKMTSSNPSDHLQWCDIEKAIRDALIGPEEKEEDPYFSQSIYHWKYELSHGKEYRGRSTFSLFYDAVSTKEEFNYPKHAFYEYLFESLRKFELLFKCYVIWECKRANLMNDFQKHADNFFNNKYFHNPDSIYTYNYTEPKNDIFAKHIHGSIENEPIFGISENSISDDIETQDLVYPFLKSTRRIVLNSEQKNSASWLDSESVSPLVFYGSSLSRQDYGTLFEFLDSINFKNVIENEKSYKDSSKIIFIYSQKIYPNDDSIKKKSPSEQNEIIKDDVERSLLDVTNNAIRLLVDYVKEKSKADRSLSEIKMLVNYFFEDKIVLIRRLED